MGKYVVPKQAIKSSNAGYPSVVQEVVIDSPYQTNFLSRQAIGDQMSLVTDIAVEFTQTGFLFNIFDKNYLSFFQVTHPHPNSPGYEIYANLVFDIGRKCVVRGGQLAMSMLHDADDPGHPGATMKLDIEYSEDQIEWKSLYSETWVGIDSGSVGSDYINVLIPQNTILRYLRAKISSMKTNLQGASTFKFYDLSLFI